MDSSTSLKQQLEDLVNSMIHQGLLDDQFKQLQKFQDATDPYFVSDVLNLFCSDVIRLLADLTMLVEKPVVDFERASDIAHQMRGSSASIGAQRMMQSCIEFHHACTVLSKDGCLRALHAIKNEFYCVQSKFEIILQLDQRIRALDDN